MPYTILLKRNATPGVVPTPASLSLGELAINTGDGLLYYLDGSGSYSGTVRAINADTASYAVTAAFAMNGGGGGGTQEVSGVIGRFGIFSGSTFITGSSRLYVSNSVAQASGGFGISGNLFISGTQISVNGVTYTWPTTNDASGTVLTNNGAGGLAWTFVSGSGGGASPTGTFTGSFTGAFQGTASAAQNSATSSLTTLARSSSWVDTSGSTNQFIFLNGRQLSGSNSLFRSGSAIVSVGTDFVASHSIARFFDVVELAQIQYSFPDGDFSSGKVLTIVSGTNIFANRSGWTAGSGTTNPGIFSGSTDGDSLTRWSTEAGQANSQSFHVQFTTTESVAGFILDTQNSINDFPLVYALSSSVDSGSTWTPRGVFSGSAVNTQTFYPFRATNLLFRIVQPRTGFFWSIHEFNVYTARQAYQLGWRDASGSGASLSIASQSSTVVTSPSVLNFFGNVQVSQSAGTASIFLPVSTSLASRSLSSSFADQALSASWAPGSSGGQIEVRDEGVVVSSNANVINFIGTGVSASLSASVVNIDVGGGSSTARSIISVQTPSLAPNQIVTGTLGIGRSFLLFSVNVNTDSRVRLYSSRSYLETDLTRTIGVDPTVAEPGIIVDLVLSGSSALYNFTLSPTVNGMNVDSSVTTDIYYAATNLSATSSSVSMSFNRLVFE